MTRNLRFVLFYLRYMYIWKMIVSCVGIIRFRRLYGLFYFRGRKKGSKEILKIYIVVTFNSVGAKVHAR